MKLRSLSSLLIASATLLAFVTHASADVVVMKDGTKFESVTVVSETADSITFDYILKGKIKDQRTEKKANIAQLIKQRPEELEIVPLRKLVPTPDLLTADKYEAMIQDQLRPFIAKYPGTAEAKEAEAMVTTLNAEKEKVVSGELKMDGKWLTSDEVKRNAHDIDAFRVRRQLTDAAAKGDWREALKVWDSLSARDSGYADSIQFVNAVPEVKAVLESYRKELDALAAAQPALKQRRDASLKALLEPELTRTKSAIAAEEAKAKADRANEKQAGTRWMSTYKYDMKTIQEAQKMVADEIKKVNAIDVPRLTTAINAVSEVRAKLAEQDIDGVTAAIANATVAISGLRDSTLSSILSKLKTQASTLKNDIAKKKAAQKAYERATALASKESAPDDSAGADDKAKTDGKAKAEEKGTGKMSAAEAAKKKIAARKPSSSSDEAKAEEGMSTSTMMMIGGGGLLAILVFVMMRQRKNQGE